MMHSTPATAAATPLAISPRGSHDLPRSPQVPATTFLNSDSNVSAHNSSLAGGVRGSSLAEPMPLAHLSAPVPTIVSEITHARLDLPIGTSSTLLETTELGGAGTRIKTLGLREDIWGPPPPEAHIPKAKAGFEYHSDMVYASRIPVAAAEEDVGDDGGPSVGAHAPGEDQEHKKKPHSVENQHTTATTPPSSPFATKFQNLWNTWVKTLTFSSDATPNKATSGEKPSQVQVGKKLWKWDTYTRVYTKLGKQPDQIVSEKMEDHEAAVQECNGGGKSWWDVPVVPREHIQTQDEFYGNVNILDRSDTMEPERKTKDGVEERFEETKAYGGFNMPESKSKSQSVTSVGFDGREHTYHEEPTVEQAITEQIYKKELEVVPQNDGTDDIVERHAIIDGPSTELNKESGTNLQLELANETNSKNIENRAGDGATMEVQEEEEEELCWVHRWLASYSAQEH